jgi:hypothetical protein
MSYPCGYDPIMKRRLPLAATGLAQALLWGSNSCLVRRSGRGFMRFMVSGRQLAPWSATVWTLRLWLAGASAAVASLALNAQTATPAEATTAAPVFTLDVAKPEANAASLTKPGISNEQFNATVAAAIVASLKPQENASDHTAIWAAAIAAIVSTVVTLLTIKATKSENIFKAKQEKEKARIDSALAFTAKMLDLEYRQLEHFYAPLLARMQQCRGIQEKLTLHLYQQSPDINYQRIKDERGVYRLKVKNEGGWVDFRLLDRLPTLKDNPIALALVDEILSIVAEMVDIIRKHNGLASVDKQMAPAYGQLLAHYAVIKLERERVKAVDCPTTPHAPGTHGDAYYPRELDALVTQEYDATRKAIKSYKDMSDKALDWLNKIAP